MTWLAGAIGLTAAGLGVLMIIGIFIRRVILTRRQRRDLAIGGELRETALKITVGTDVSVPPLTRRQASVFTEQLGELALAVQGDGRDRIAAAAEELGLVEVELRRLRTSRRPWKRASAARVLGALGSARASTQLVDALSDPDRDVRATAARSLGHLRIADAAGSVVRALAEGRLPRAVVVETTLLLGPSAFPSLRAHAGSGPTRARATCIELIGHLGDARDGQGMAAFLDDPAADVRASTARALGRLGSRSTLEPLIGALRDPVDFVRGAAAEALGRLNAERAVEALVQVANTDPSWWAAAWAARSVARIDPGRVRAEASQPDASMHILEAADVLAL